MTTSRFRQRSIHFSAAVTTLVLVLVTTNVPAATDGVIAPTFSSHTDHLTSKYDEMLTYQLLVSGSVATFNSSNLPLWMSLTPSGKLAGVPQTPGVFSLAITAYNSAGYDTLNLIVTISPNTTGTITYSESDSEKIAALDNANEDVYFPSFHILSMDATLNLPAGTKFISGTPFEIVFGTYSFYSSIDSADKFKIGKSAFWSFDYPYYDEKGYLELSYNRNTLNIKLYLKEDDFYGTDYAVLGQYMGSTQTVSGTATATIIFGGQAAAFVVGVSGSTKDKTVVHSKGVNPYSLYFDSGNVKGKGTAQ